MREMKITEIQEKLKKQRDEIEDLRKRAGSDLPNKVNEIFQEVMKTINSSLEDIGEIESNRIVLKVVVAGSYSSGKSTFINSLIEDDLIPMGQTPLTGVVTVLKYGHKGKIVAKLSDGTEKEITRDEFKECSTKNMPNRKDKRYLKPEQIERIEISLNKKILEDIYLIDTPGYETNKAVNPNRADDKKTRKEVEQSDVLFWVIDATDGTLPESQRRILEQLGEIETIAIINQSEMKPPESRQRIAVEVGKQSPKIKKAIIYSAKLLLENQKAEDPWEKFVEITKKMHETLSNGEYINVKISDVSAQLEVFKPKKPWIERNFFKSTKSDSKFGQTLIMLRKTQNGELKRFKQDAEILREALADWKARKRKIKIATLLKNLEEVNSNKSKLHKLAESSRKETIKRIKEEELDIKRTSEVRKKEIKNYIRAVKKDYKKQLYGDLLHLIYEDIEDAHLYTAMIMTNSRPSERNIQKIITKFTNTAVEKCFVFVSDKLYKYKAIEPQVILGEAKKEFAKFIQLYVSQATSNFVLWLRAFPDSCWGRPVNGTHIRKWGILNPFPDDIDEETVKLLREDIDLHIEDEKLFEELNGTLLSVEKKFTQGCFEEIKIKSLYI